MVDWVRLTDMELSCSIGVFEGERERRQRLSLELGFGLDLDGAAEDDLEQTVDYYQSLAEARFIAESAHFGLIESLGITLCHWFLSAPRAVLLQKVQVVVRKPEACGGRGNPEVELCRDRAWLERRRSARSETQQIELVAQTPSAWVARVELSKGQGFSADDLPMPLSSLPQPRRISLLVSSGQARSEEGVTYGTLEAIHSVTRVHALGDESLYLLVLAELA